MTDQAPTILFTAFEPSGDDHAAPVIAALLDRHPEARIHAWGGPKMERAGARIVERTGEDAVVGMPGIEKLLEHRRINRRIGAWLDDHPVAVHVPVDAPGANFPICAIAKRRGIKVVHLVAPQVWAWGVWRVAKLRRLTDLVLCLLPFEEGWLTTRGVPARFIGHPLFGEELDVSALDEQAAGYQRHTVNLAIMPGSRPGELHKNFPLLLDAFRQIRAAHPEVGGLIAARDEATEVRLRCIANEFGGWPERLDMVAGVADAVIRWCDLALVVSGTITLQVARQLKPMVVVYKENFWGWHLIGKWIVRTRHFALPNIIAGRRVVPELIPHFTGPEPISESVLALIDDPPRLEQQRRDLAEVCQRFRGRNAATEAAEAIASMAGM